MPLYRYTVRAYLRAVESGNDLNSTITRACDLLRNYEISKIEIEGYNEAAGTNIQTFEMMPVPADSSIEQAHQHSTGALIGTDISIEIDADDERQAARDGRDALGFLDLDPYFLAGYNERHGTRFTGFSLENLDESLVDDISEPHASVRLTAPNEAEMIRIRQLFPCPEEL